MDLDQIITRLDWLDEERRKDKTLIVNLEEKIKGLENSLTGFTSQYSELSGELARMGVLLSRIEASESSIAQVKQDMSRFMETIDKQRVENAREADKIRRADIESFNKTFGELQKGLEGVSEIKKSLQMRVDEEFRLSRLLDGIKKEIDTANRSEEDFKRMQRVMEDNYRQDSKRVSDMQADISILRKRADEQRGKTDLLTETSRKLDLKINEIQSSENERKQNQMSFIEKQNMQTIDRDRTWKEWNQQFEDIIQKATSLDSQIQTLEMTNRAIKRSQDAFDEIIQRFDRRVNEITEMQRLVEERFRQEWTNFKADDQKRWTNYTLSNDEKQRELSRQVEKQNGRLVIVEDATHELKDLVNQINEEIQNRLQGLLAISHQWMDDYDRLFGKNRQV